MTIKVQPVSPEWNSALPVFAREEFLRAVGDEYGWLGGVDESGALRCVLPYTIVRKAGLRMVRFRTGIIPWNSDLEVHDEESFLNDVVRHFRRVRADVIIPPSNNAIFRTYPEGASAAPYATYVIDLQRSENALWTNIGRKTRQNISTARKAGVLIRDGMEDLPHAYDLIRNTFRRSNLPFLTRDEFERFAHGLGQNGKLLTAQLHGIIQSQCLFAFSEPCAYAIYAGNIEHQQQGANKLLYWEAIRLFHDMGVRRFDFYGARIRPAVGSKQEGINLLKMLMGGIPAEGYLWKYSLRPWRALLYSLGVRVLRGGDIVDKEARRLKGYRIIAENAGASSCAVG